MSDLHCHAKADKSERLTESFLIAGTRRIPESRHPTEALLQLIKKGKLTADFVVCPGDLTNRVCEAGMSHAFADLKSIRDAMNAKELLCCLGNHDVASRGGSVGNDPFRLARELAPGFPVEGHDAKDRLESSGFHLFNFKKEKASLLLVNSVIDHQDEESAKRGTFDDNRLSQLNEYLTKEKSSMASRRIAVMHHHPYLHTFAGHDSSDVLSNGDAIIECLAKHRFRMIIHGHRHQSRLTIADSPSGPLVVFAAGSFSAILRELSTVTRNLFHIIRIGGGTSILKGSIESWEFNFGIGWNPTSVQSSAVAHHQEFSSNSAPVTAVEVADLVKNSPQKSLSREQLNQSIPNLRYLVPQRIKKLSEDLMEEHNLKMAFDEAGQFTVVGETLK